MTGLAGLEDDSTLEITATATDADGNTSEFSACVTAEFVLGYDGEATWHYEYDGLYRVTYACDAWDEAGASCTGTEWTYEYDGAGNLTRYDRWQADTQSVVTVGYVYNGANQIACVDTDLDGDCTGEVNYQYDAYGNLLSDGISTYTYDGAMRLTSVTGGVSTTTYSYTGDGDRIAQTVDGVTTTYVLDTASSLTMVLAESTTGEDPIYYLHGLDLVAQSDGATTEYFGYDGLGSVRQVFDAAGDPVMTQTFDPYGSRYGYAGPESVTSVGYTGEFEDGNGLLFLRARFYNPAFGRFLNADPSRQEVNPYQYAASNPVMYVDPSGLISPIEASSALSTIDDVKRRYSISIEVDFGYLEHRRNRDVFIRYGSATRLLSGCSWEDGDWSAQNIIDIQHAIDDIRDALITAYQNTTGNSLSIPRAEAEIRETWGNVRIQPTDRNLTLAIMGRWVLINSDYRAATSSLFKYTIAHEMGHIWDYRSHNELSGQVEIHQYGSAIPATGLAGAVGRQHRQCSGYTQSSCFTSGEIPPGWNESISSRNNYAARGQGAYSAVREDFADSFASYVDQNNWSGADQVNLSPGSIRWTYIESALSSLVE